MKADKTIVRVLALLGFGAAVGLTVGCGANRASKSRTLGENPAADSTATVGHGSDTMRIMVMYGVRPTPFDVRKPIPKSAGEPAEEATQATTPPPAPTE